ncbi:MAG: efflux transporter outer membrane subunit [Methylacidiphilales bacterium]|nr:efflux transporter outer membrane subunit [Candidatus Methylacidiphilales bacterium]
MPKLALRNPAVVLTAGITLLTGCSVGPDYVQPSAPQASAYKESGPWKKAEPRDDISKGNWYSVFHDPKLNQLETQAEFSSQTLRAAIARVSEARAVARETEANFFPTIDFQGTGSRQRTSPNNGQLVSQSQGVPTSASTFTSATVVPFDLSYEVDIWGKVRRAFESSGDLAQASLADYENVLLTLKADVATDYFAVRTADSQISVQLRTIESYQQNLNLTNSRFQGGISTQLDVEQAEATLASAQAQLATLRQNRAQMEHAVAVLLGVPPEGFSLPYHPLDTRLPVIPAGLPSDLLERRPDVAAAERRVAAQNAAIGVAIAAYFPQVNLTGQTGFDSGDLGLLFNWESRIWSYGPNIQFPIFEGGQISANVKQQKATYEENVANYREQVLVAFQDVEDSLSALRYLSQQSEAENRAYQAYSKALDLTNARYTTGLVSYFDVIQAQGLALGAEQLTVQIEGDRIATTVQLIKALGGGWADSFITKPDHGNHVTSPTSPPTVLGPAGKPTANP